MKETLKQVLASIIELAIFKDSRKIKTPWAGLRLRATFREDEDLLLRSELDNLRDVEKLINSWTEEGDSVSITISESQEIPTANSSEKDAVSDRAIRRALILPTSASTVMPIKGLASGSSSRMVIRNNILSRKYPY